MADKTNKNEGNKDQVLLSSSLNYKLNDDSSISSSNNNDGIKCLVLNNNNNNNYILGQELKNNNTNNFFTPDNVAKAAEKSNDSIASIDANLLLGDYGPTPPLLPQPSVTTKFNENASLTSYSTPKSFGFLNSYQKQSDYSNESLGVGVFETYKPVNCLNDANDYTNNQDWQLNLQLSSASTQSNQQQLVNYSDFVPNQAYSTSTNGPLFSAHSYQYQATNVETNGSNNSLYQNSRSFNYRPTPNDDMYATQSNRINSVIGKSQYFFSAIGLF
jgi:hypothetical protein